MERAMKKYKFLHISFLLLFLSLGLQSCLGIGDNNNNTTNNDNFQQTSTGANGSTIGINKTDQAIFKGKIYFTLDHNLYVLDGTRVPKQLTHGMMILDPAVSPDGKWIAFSVRYKNYADLAYMPTGGGPLHIVATGNGQFFQGGDGTNNFYWFAQPAWSADSKNLIFLSDLQKMFYWKRLGNPFNNAYFPDLQVFSLPIGQPTLTAAQALDAAQTIAYADFGNGGDRDPSYRPQHNNEVVYTHYTYNTGGTEQLVQILLEDANAIANNPGKYTPGVGGSGFDPSVAITPKDTNKQCLQPAFSPDGNSIAYIQRQDSTHMGLSIMPVAENVTQNPNDPVTAKKALVPYNNKSSMIQSGQYISQPFWSPDGKQLAYLSYSNGVYDIWLTNVSVDNKTGTYKMAGDPVQLTSANGHLDGESRPFWTP
jgi:WD40-like Beta Propeller Repeat